MKLTLLDRFIKFFWEIPDPYDEHAQAVVGRASSRALLLVLPIEFAFSMVINQHPNNWLVWANMIFITGVITWVGWYLSRAGLGRHVITPAELPQVLRKLKRSAVWNGAFGAGILVVFIGLADWGEHHFPLIVVVALVVGVIFGFGQYFNAKSNLKVEDD